LANDQNFGQKIQILIENPTFGEQSIFGETILILVEKPRYGEQSKFL